MARRQLHALFRHQAQERVVRWLRHIAVYVRQHLLIAVRSGDFQHLWMHFTDLILFRAQAAGDDHLTVFIQRFADRFQRFLYCAVDESAGVDDDDFGIVITWNHFIAFGAQLGEDAFRVDQIFRAAERNKSDTRRHSCILRHYSFPVLHSNFARDSTHLYAEFIQQYEV